MRDRKDERKPKKLFNCHLKFRLLSITFGGSEKTVAVSSALRVTLFGKAPQIVQLYKETPYASRLLQQGVLELNELLGCQSGCNPSQLRAHKELGSSEKGIRVSTGCQGYLFLTW